MCFKYMTLCESYYKYTGFLYKMTVFWVASFTRADIQLHAKYIVNDYNGLGLGNT